MTDQNLEVCWLRLEQLRQKQEVKQQYWNDVKIGVASAFLSVTWLFIRAAQAIIPFVSRSMLHIGINN